MPKPERPVDSATLPDGCSAIPILQSEVGAILRVCVLVRNAADPATGHFVLLRDLPDARVYLGCLTDAAGSLRDWIELWVQDVDGLQTVLPALRQGLSNHLLDQQWAKWASDFRALNSGGFIQTGWETKHPLPAYLDVRGHQPVHPGTPESRWELCRDDAALQGAGLPPYDTSLARYIFRPVAKESGFVPVVAGAPVSPATRPAAEALKEVQGHVPLNPQGGLLLAQRFSPIGYEDYVDLLSGKAWKGMEIGKRHFQFDSIYRHLDDWSLMQQSGSHLFLGGQGKAGRFVETFHLKLQLLFDLLTQARAFVERQQLPFLNLGAESFRVRLGDLGAKLPVLWTANASLVKPGEAMPLPVEASDFRYFVRARANNPSIYQPESLNAALQGSGSVRLRKVLPPDSNRTVLEATLVLQDRVQISPHDLLWVRLPLANGRIDLYGHLNTTEGLAQGEARFRTVPTMFSPETLTALKAAEGLAFPSAPFHIVPLLSTPCDLYALGVLAVRTLLVNPQNTLAVALDEVLSLARQVATEHKPDMPLVGRIGAILNADSRFRDSLAPHRLVQEPIEPKTAYELLPAELWHRTLAAIVRLFPGLGPDSHCKDYGDAPALALEAVFNQPVEEFDQLLVRSRSLVVIDWNANREINSAIQDFRDRQI